jgi:hypothetical protein
LNSTSLSTAQKFNLHALVIALLVLIPSVVSIQPLLDYANQIVDARKQEAPHLLPDLAVHYPANTEVANKLPHLLVDQVSDRCGLEIFFLLRPWFRWRSART